jgi:hypothetical protein
MYHFPLGGRSGAARRPGVRQRTWRLRQRSKRLLGWCTGYRYVSAQYSEGKNAFSPATASPDPIHNWTNQGQAFGIFTYKINDNTKISLTLSTAASELRARSIQKPKTTMNGIWASFNR